MTRFCYRAKTCARELASLASRGPPPWTTGTDREGRMEDGVGDDGTDMTGRTDR